MYITRLNDEFISLMIERSDASMMFSLLQQILPQVQNGDADSIRRCKIFVENVLTKLNGGANGQ